MKTSSSAESKIQEAASAIYNIAHASNKKSKKLKSNLDKEVTKSLSKAQINIESARKSAGENRGEKANKSALYSAAILIELNRRDPNLGKKFLDRFQANLILTKSYNNEAIKPAAHQALNDLVRAGDLSLNDTKQITHAAWKLVFKDFAKLENKSEKTPKTAALSITANNSSQGSKATESSQSSQAPRGFLWKPIADSPPHGLAILLPPEWTGQIEGLQILDPKSGQVIATGQDGGVGNGDRQHFRFKNQGADFPDGAIVRVQFTDGSTKEIVVSNTATRVEGR